MASNAKNTVVCALLAGLFSACSSTPKPSQTAQIPADAVKIPEPLPHKEPPSTTGNPEFYEVFGKRYFVLGSSEGFRETGIASWYGADFHGKKTSSGPPFDMYGVTAAHKNLPLPCYVRVTHLGNGRSIVVRVNDRGPFVGERIIDLSYAAAVKLDMLDEGTAPVEVTALPPYQYLAGYSPGQTKRYAAVDHNVTDRPPAGNRQLASLSSSNPAPAAFKPQPPRTDAFDKSQQSIPAILDNRPSGSDRSVRFASTQVPAMPAIRDAVYRPAAEAVRAAPKAPPAANHRLYLQVGAFAEANRARQMKQQLAARFRQSVLIDSTAGKLHKVRIGPLSNSSEAEQLVIKLASLGIKAHPVTM